MFNGETLSADIDLTLDESLREGGITKEIQIERQIICPDCFGSRSNSNSKPSACNLCNMKGTRVDPLFKHEVKCLLCQGHGTLVKDLCKRCVGSGLVSAT